MSRREPYSTVRPAQTDDEIRAMTDDGLDSLIRTADMMLPHVPTGSAAAHQIRHRRQVAWVEQCHRARQPAA